MTRVELMREVVRGRLLIVGEFRGARAEADGYVDRTTGEKIGYVRGILLAECEVRGNLSRAIFYQRLPDSVEKPEEAVFPYQKGKLYVFFLTSLKNDNGQVIGSLSDRAPELLQDEQAEEETVGAPSRGTHRAPPNLVNIKNNSTEMI
ncbi:MAG: hypothetical protein ABSE62_00975 [Chthoniobacteraceae bacterium]|jgi:hypothetical protein